MKNPGIEMPPIKRIADGTMVSSEQALKITTQPSIVTYEWNGLELAIGLDPKAVRSADEDIVQEIQLELAELAELDIASLATSQGDEAATEKAAKDVQKSLLSGGNGKTAMMTKIMRRASDATIDMLCKAILWCNDPNEENHPTAQRLKAGGKLAAVQFAAIQEWWNPTAPPVMAETKTTENQKSGDLPPS